MIFQPTNINPDIKGGLGYGTRDLTQGLTVAWIVNGNTPLQAFMIGIYSNDAASTQLYTTGKLTDDCPFYPTNYAGEQQAMSYTIDAATLAGASIVNGSEYKLLIRQWYGAGNDDYVDQSSASVFVGKADPTLTIDAIPAPLIARSYTFTATYAQAQGDALNWVRWQIASADDQSNPFYDTGNIYGTAQLQVSYDGFFTGNTYSIQCSAQTVSGVDVTTGWVDFDVDYPQTAIEGAASAVCVKGKNAVKVSFSPLSSIVGTGTGTYSFADGKITLASGANVVWNTVNGETMNFNSPWSMILKCNPNGTTTTRNFCELITDTFAVTDPDFGDVLERYRIGMRFYSSTSLSVIVFLDYSTDDGATWNIMANNNIIAQFTGSIGSSDATYLVTPTTAYIRCNTQTAEKQMSGIYWEDAITRPIQSVTILGVGIVDYLQIFDGNGASAYVQGAITDGTYTPIYDANTIFLASFDNADLSAGNMATVANIEDIAIYRKGANETTLTHVANAQLGDTYVYDYGAQSQQGDYTYYVVPRATEISTKSTSGNPIATFEADGLPFLSIKVNFTPQQDLNGEASPWIGYAETTPYLFREAGGGATVGNSEFDSIVGGTVAWNQLLQNGDFANGTTNWTKNSSASWATADNVLTLTAATGTSNNRIYQEISTVTGHKLIFAFSIKSATLTSAEGQLSTSAGLVGSDTLTIGSSWTRFNMIVSANGDALNAKIGTRTVLDSAATLDIKNVFVADLTQMFNTTIADYVYTLESGTAGAGVAWLKAHGYFTKDYYAYDAGSLQSVCAASHVIGGGKNLYNPAEKTASSSNTFLVLNVVPNTDYTFSVDVSQSGLYAQEDEDGDGTWINIATAYNATVLTFNSGNHTRIRVMTYSSANTLPTQWQLEFGTTATAYTPYVAPTVYPLDESLTLRGIPKLDANNKLYFDGDKYTADGTVTRRYGIVDLGTLNWVQDGTNGFYAVVSGIASATIRQLEFACSFLEVISDGRSFANCPIPSIYAYGSSRVYVKDGGVHADSTAFTAWVNGQTICYPLATATTEAANQFTARQEVTAGGTEEYYDGNLWGCVDLGTLTWTNNYYGDNSKNWYTSDLSGLVPTYADADVANVVCENYTPVSTNDIYNKTSGIAIRSNTTVLVNTPSGDKPTGMLIYPLATPTRAFSLPVGHSTNYANYCPISGETGADVQVTGENILANIATTKTQNNVTFTINADKSVTISTNGAASANTFCNLDYVGDLSSAVALAPTGVNCTVKGGFGSGILIGVGYFISDGTGITIGNYSADTTFQYPVEAVKMRTYLRVSSGTTIATPITVYPKIEIGDEATPYVPYAGNTYVVDWSRKNLCDPAQKTVYIEGKGWRWNNSNPITLFAGKSYTFSVSGTSDSIQLYIVQKSPETYLVQGASPITYTPTADVAVYLQAYCGAGFSDGNNFQFEQSATATPYVPFTVKGVGEAFGGYYDLITGEMKLTWCNADLANLAWGGVSGQPHLHVTLGLSGMIEKPATNYVITRAISDIYEAAGFGNITVLEGKFGVGTSGHIRIKDSRFDNYQECQAGIGGIHICFPLDSAKKFNAVDLGTLDWTKYAPVGTNLNTLFINTTMPLSDSNLNGNINTATSNALSTNYTMVKRNDLYSVLGQRGISAETVSGDGWIYISDPSMDSLTADEFKEAMRGVYLIYESTQDTPIVISPKSIDTLEGANNVWDDIGTVDTEYEIYTEQPAPLITNPLCVSWWMWTVLECTKDEDGFYQVLNAYNFRNNLTSGKISNNNSPNVALNFTKYPTVQTVPQNFKSGALQSLIGAVTLNPNTGVMEYSDTLTLRNNIYNLSTTTNPLFLKNTKGDLLKIKINGAIEMETSDNTRELMQTMELPWVEVGSTKGISIIGY